jgi:hypothetical protein
MLWKIKIIHVFNMKNLGISIIEPCMSIFLTNEP